MIQDSHRRQVRRLLGQHRGLRIRRWRDRGGPDRWQGKTRASDKHDRHGPRRRSGLVTPRRSDSVPSPRPKNSDVYVIDAAGKNEAKPLADDPDADEQDPSWSPSADQIAYKSIAEAKEWPDDARSSVGDGQQWRQSACAVDQRWGTAWRPDGAELELALMWSPLTNQSSSRVG